MTDDLLVSTLNVGSRLFEGFGDSELVVIKTHFISKRFRHEGRMLGAWEAVSLIPESTVLGTPAIYWAQRGWSEHSSCFSSGELGCAISTYIEASISAQSNEGVDMGKRGLEILQFMAAALDEKGRSVEKELEGILTASKNRSLV